MACEQIGHCGLCIYLCVLTVELALAFCLQCTVCPQGQAFLPVQAACGSVLSTAASNSWSPEILSYPLGTVITCRKLDGDAFVT